MRTRRAADESRFCDYPAILTTDLHLTAREDDEYRWSLFETLQDIRDNDGARSLIILGDLTDAKDNHSAALVNRVVTSIVAVGLPTIVLMGNHDYKVIGSPYFEFLNHLEHVRFITEPTMIGEWLFLPHSRADRIPGWSMMRDKPAYCFMHQTIRGAIGENGQRMEHGIEGVEGHWGATKIYSGDIHVPQQVGHVEYVGAPYPVHYGDTYKGRVRVLRSAEHDDYHDYPWRGVQRATLDVGSDGGIPDTLRAGDQVKVRLTLRADEMHEWHSIKERVQRACDMRGLSLSSIELIRPRARVQLLGDAPAIQSTSPAHVLERYMKSQGIEGGVARMGREIVRG